MNWRTIRPWIYGVLVSAGPLITAYGIADENQVALWLGLGAALLGSPTGAIALANLTPKSEDTVVIEPAAPAVEEAEVVEVDDPGATVQGALPLAEEDGPKHAA